MLDIKCNIQQLLLLIIVSCIWQRSLGDIFEECNSVGNTDNFVASNKSCTHYIFCSGEDSFEGECPEENDYFNAQLAMCEPMQDVDCRTGLPLQTQQETVTGSVTESVTNSVTNSVTEEQIVTNTVTETVNFTIISSTAPSVIIESVTELPVVDSTLINKVVTIVAKDCPQTDSYNLIVLLAHDKSCTEYFICYHGKPLPMTCASMLHFNAKTGKCDKSEIVNCMRSSISVREQCKLHTVDIYPHPDNCNYFYYCRNGYLMLQQCPFFYGWDYEKRSCVAISRAKCYNPQRLLN